MPPKPSPGEPAPGPKPSTPSGPRDYLLAGAATEHERLTLQARVWEPEAERLLDAINVRPGWHCVDVGCGALGVLCPLSRRVGPAGKVIGTDADADLLANASTCSCENALPNVELVRDDAYASSLPAASFDLVHVRFLFAPGGHDDVLLGQLLRLARPGGVIAVQEPDSTSWGSHPPSPALDALVELVRRAFRQGGGDFDAGRRMFGLLRRAGLRDVRARSAVLTLPHPHPYRRIATLFAASLRPRIVEAGLATDAELDALVEYVQHLADDPDVMMTSFMVHQVWGRREEGSRRNDEG